MSYGYSGVATIADITSFVYKGVTTQRPAGGWTNAQLANFGVTRRGTANNIFYPARIADIDADIVDAIADGIIFCGAAGNDSMYNERLGGDMYDNYFVIPSGGINYGYFYHRGMSPTAATGVINVSAIDSTVIERKVAFSNAGPRTDIFAAGTNIMSSINDPSQSGGAGDVRSIAPNTFWKNKLSGTSMASPQVTGIVACALETYPNMTPAEALTYAQTYANSGVLVDPTINTDFVANELIRANTLFNGPNLFMTYRQERDSRNQVYPKLNYSYRPTSGLIFPRTRARKFG
jgi:subtilisin family serine protease